jgi:uncharacterized protein (TIGR00266 family)
MQAKIHGTTMQTLEILLQPGEKMYSQTHSLAYMSASVMTNPQMTKPNQQGGGFLGGLWSAAKRALTGGSLFQNVFWAEGIPGLVAFCPRFPGQIVRRDLAAGESLICRKETFLCAEASVDFDIYFRQQLGGGLFGGEGFLLQKVTGPGAVFLDLSGEVIEKTLGVGEKLRIHVGHLGVQDASVSFNIELVPGVKNFLFGGNGIFYAACTGPGKVLLQSMPIAILAEEIGRHLGDREQPQTGAGAVGGVIGVAGELLKDWDNK